MGFKKNVYRTFGGILAALTIVGSPGCAVKPTEETTVPSTPIESLDPTIKPTLTPLPTPEPTPDLSFEIDDIDNEESLRNYSQLVSNKFNTSNVPYSDYYKLMEEETLMNYLKWCNARKPYEEINSVAAQNVLDCFINPIGNEELMIIRDILTGTIDPIKNADFLGYSIIMPISSKAHELATRINEIKNELASLPSKERQIELAQESLNISLDFMLSNDAPYNEENVKNHFMIEDDGRNIENSDIETYAFKISMWFDIDSLINAAYIIKPNLKPQYPFWHPQYPNYIEIEAYYKKYTDTFEYIYYQTTQKMVDECMAYSNSTVPTLNSKN